MSPEQIIEAIAALTRQARDRLFEDLIPSRFCRFCGSDAGYRCTCRRDD